MIGETVSHYKIIEKLGAGGMGVVYLAEDTKLDRQVALKFLPEHISSNDLEKQRFIHEAKAASKLDHKNICTIHEIDETADGQLFIVMACYKGETLKDRIEKGKISAEEAVRITTQIAEGLNKAHQADIVHRDLKPANIMLTEDNEVKILDFGLAKLSGQSKLTKTGTTLGTVAYMSPEQARGEDVDSRTDLWSLGVILFEMLSGQLPFSGDYDQAVVYSIINDSHEPLPAAAENLQYIIDKSLEKTPPQRYQSGSELLTDLHESSLPVKYMPQTRKKLHVSRRWIITVTVVITASILLFLMPLLLEEPPLASSRQPLLVMPFENQTGDPDYDYLRAAIPNLLLTNLEQSKYVTVLTWERIQDQLKILGKPELEVVDIDQETGFELCHMDGVHAIVMGSFTRAGNLFATDIKVLDTNSKKLLVSANSKGEGAESILRNQIDELSKAISGGVIFLSEEKAPEELNILDVTTQSLDAYRLYHEALRRYHRFDFVGAHERFVRALSIDSTFAMAYYYTAKTLRALGDQQAGLAAQKQAMRFSVNTPEREALYIKMQFAARVEINPQKAFEINRKLVALYPNEKEAHRQLAAKYRQQGRNSDAIGEYKKAIKLDPNWSSIYNDLSYAYAKSGDYEEALASSEKYMELSTGGPNPLDTRADIQMVAGRLNGAIKTLEMTVRRYPDWYGTFFVSLSFAYALKEDYQKALQTYHDLNSIYERSSVIRDKPRLLAWNYQYNALLYYQLGRHEEAVELIKKIVPLGDEYINARALELLAFIHADRENFREADKYFQHARNIRATIRPSDEFFWNVCYNCLSAYMELKAGNIDQAVRKNAEVTGLLPQLTHRKKEIYNFWIQILTAEILLAKGETDNAIRVFRETKPPNPYFLTWWYKYDYYLPLHRDGLARAYIATGNLNSAITEYKRLITFNPESKERFLIHPVYHFRLGRLYEESSQFELAIQEYKLFLQFWENADKDLPELLEAKMRLNILSSGNNSISFSPGVIQPEQNRPVK